MTKQFIPYEIAWKLKEIGFTEPCIGWWYNPTGNDPDLFLVEGREAEDNNSVVLDPDREDMKDVVNWEQICESKKLSCSAPLWQQIIDWFREKHSIDILIEPAGVANMYSVFVKNWIYENEKDRAMYTYPEARQAAIEYALTLI